MKKILVPAALAVAACVSLSGTAQATMVIKKSAQTAGFEATACTYCHVDKLPKKDAAKLNERGTWLKEQKAKKSAKEIDGAWLKDYKEAKK